MLAMYFVREYTNLSLKTIGIYFGGRDHSTVVHACKWVEEQLVVNEPFSKRIGVLREKIQSIV